MLDDARLPEMTSGSSYRPRARAAEERYPERRGLDLAAVARAGGAVPAAGPAAIAVIPTQGGAG